MIRKPFLLKIYEAASMQRWNDQIRPVELTELDKQAHKMIITYVLGKCEEENNNPDFDWVEIIEGGIFEFLQRIILTDLKPPLFHKIKENRERYLQLNEWVYERISSVISPFGEGFCKRFKEYLMESEDNINSRILNAAHFYATKWEFDIIERSNPNGYLIEEIKIDIQNKQKNYRDLPCTQKLSALPRLQDFLNICGQLRFQIRWSHLHRVPKTSVLGHMLIVAIFSYLFSLQLNGEKQRCVNNFFTGLFHDLPEVLTRDIINPVKRSVEGLKDLITEYEREEMERKIYRLMPEKWLPEMKTFTENEFTKIVSPEGKIVRDGELLKAIDDLSAFIEVYLALKNGIHSESLEGAKYSIIEQYRQRNISGINFGQIYADFD
ncbi:MAG: HD domain-containing protein [Candidatus Scalindua sp. AMX11]|nr:MAG: HD domain-containing protein [Candidatus Scalindua sp.]NOG83958.1 HD domain-containing protein [Planctomycetota bacterium]RZV88029.1 MAG: HD domain-containing protein [Candidatus Scalindua sp. SCAELEC01]TDE63803.1 MAG: HD domain-containing protein [Candidatus Scalindua sp. AMX11]GJQ58393.1 MAG: phosphohydrolase [Candidatus Scalindua sp.]